MMVAMAVVAQHNRSHDPRRRRVLMKALIFDHAGCGCHACGFDDRRDGRGLLRRERVAPLRQSAEDLAEVRQYLLGLRQNLETTVEQARRR
jgi:hypothetical protein